MKILNELNGAINKEQEKLNNYIEQINQNLNQLQNENVKRFNRAKNNFLDSLDYSDCYGKSMFYLSLMMVRPERKELLYNEVRESENALATLEEQFTEREEDEKYIQKEDLN